MAKQLSEFTFTVDTTHRLLCSLERLWKKVQIHPYAVAPSQIAEGRYEGYDAKIAGVKLLLLQFKRPNKRRGFIYFHIPHRQLITLLTRARWRRGVAYYVLPTIFTEHELQCSILRHRYFQDIVFVDAIDIPANTTAIEFRDNGWYNDRGVCIPTLMWPKILRMLVRCEVGLPFFQLQQKKYVLTPMGNDFIALGRTLYKLSTKFRYTKEYHIRMAVIANYMRLLEENPELLNDSICKDKRKKDLQFIREYMGPNDKNLEKKNIDFATGGIRRCQCLFAPVQNLLQSTMI